MYNVSQKFDKLLGKCNKIICEDFVFRFHFEKFIE